MSRLHAVATTAEEVAAHFGVEPVPYFEVPIETVEGLPGLVVFERGGRRHLRLMTWGFPRLSRAMHTRGEEPNRIGLVADLTSPMWDEMVVEPKYRCLIPITHFANPDGPAGAKTRTWFSVKDQPIVAWAGFCRNIPDQGPLYAGMTMEANDAIPPTNDRMPVLLEPSEYERWLHGTVQDVIQFQYRAPFDASRAVRCIAHHSGGDRGPVAQRQGSAAPGAARTSTGSALRPAVAAVADLFGPLEGSTLPGLSSWPEVIPPTRERDIIENIDATELSPFRFQGWLGKRHTRSYGWTYDFDTGRFAKGEPMPQWLISVRDEVAEAVDLPADGLEQALLIRYDPGAGIGWHKDRPVFEHVVGLSLGNPATLRFRRRRADRGFERFSLEAQPRSLYRLSGEARCAWEHSIAEMEVPRRSITFRTLAR